MKHQNSSDSSEPIDLSKPFTGTIEEFLEHCLSDDSNLDVILDKRIKAEDYSPDQIETYEELIEYLMQKENVTREIAVETVEEYKQDLNFEIDSALKKFIEMGLVEVVKYNDDLEPMYVLTELGKKYHAETEKPDDI